MNMFTPTQAAKAASRARRLLRAGRLTAHDYAVLDALLWCARPPGADTVTAAYSHIARLAHVAYSTAVQAISRLEALGLLVRIRRHALVTWSNGGRAWRQLCNSYRFARCESAPRSDLEKKEIIHVALALPPSPDVAKAQAALEQRRRAVEAALLGARRPA